MFRPFGDFAFFLAFPPPGRGVLPGAAGRGVRLRFEPLGVREGLRVPLGVREDRDRGLRVPLGVREPEGRRFHVPLGVRDGERGVRCLAERPRGVPRGVPPLGRGTRVPRGVRGVLPPRGVRPGAAGIEAARCFWLGRWCDVLGLFLHVQTPQVQYGAHMPLGAGIFGFLACRPAPPVPPWPEGSGLAGAAGLGPGASPPITW